MILMAKAYGADAQMVAIMQYLRVLIVAAVASAAARLWGGGVHHVHHALHAVVWFPPIAWPAFASTLALALGGGVLGRLLRVPAGPLLVPMVAGIVLVHHGWITIELPRWLLMIAYALVGWQVGLRFTRSLLLHAARALPRIIACSLALVAACCGLAALLVAVAGVDPLTAYLATSPGGADSVAIIAASSNVDVPFVMAMQIVRFVAVLIFGPPIARLLVRSTSRRERSRTAPADPSSTRSR